MKTPKLLAVLFIAAAVSPAPAPALSVEQEARYQALLEELRCMVCQNQTLAESDADLAGDLRERVFVMVEEGRSDDEILSFMTDRYGDFIRYRPPVKPETYLLWAAPFILLVILAGGLFRFVAAREKSQEKTPE